MSAKKKLNSANVVGVLLVAGVLGGLTGSWAVFALAAAALTAAAVHSGDIRP